MNLESLGTAEFYPNVYVKGLINYTLISMVVIHFGNIINIHIFVGLGMNPEISCV